MRNALLIPAAIISLVVGYCVYGQIRCMQETTGFIAQVVLKSLIFGFVIPIVISAVAFSIVSILRKLDFQKYKVTALILSGFLLLGNSVSELTILLDESKFKVAALKTPNVAFSRARAWPNEVCRLVFIPEKGVHATD